ncbi:glycosyl transferase group 1 [Rhodopirellula maiorica SM1]|uniref:Glycosyl transferase group 1 n=1 Tax=Rhodopirellula maiorica SM1 TaxID=1265738 RepID=M5RKW0_9BACT|nr:glycosyltransferase family 1 protein [Rhodopirellula maiorica]EMI19950.1 glycosyl transferase group 1 [Rhodopirellula maiorica SM1]
MQQTATFSQRNLKNADIIHSPFHSFPKLDFSLPRPVRFLTVHDLIPLKFPELFDPAIAMTQRQTLDQLTKRDWIICNSQNTRNDLLQFCDTLHPDHAVVTPLAAAEHFARCTDTQQIEQVRKKLNIPLNAQYFLSVCTLEPRKNLRHLVTVFEQILNQLDKDTYLVLVGAKGWKIDSLIQYLAKSGNQNILTPGKVDEEDLAPLYSDAIAFVYPSLYEGFGLPPLEAMQCGTPVICSDNSSLPEVVGDAGILIDAEQPDDLGDAMTRVYADHDLRRSLSAAGLERAQRFSWQQCGQMTVNAYQRAIESIE